MITNFDELRSRRTYNKYLISYPTCIESEYSITEPVVILETTYTTVSFPTVRFSINSFIGEYCKEKFPSAVEKYELEPFEMQVQGIDRTLVDKVFAICDYYLNNDIQKHSRHLYDIHNLLKFVTLDKNFEQLISEVRDVRSESPVCPSAIKVTWMLKRYWRR